MLSSLVQDVRYALRLLRRAPGFTVVATLTLALGIGGNAAIFSVVSGVLLRPLPFRDHDRLVVVQRSIPGNPTLGDSTSPGNLYDWIDRQRSFDALAGWDTTVLSKTAPGEAERLQGTIAAGALFEVLQTPAARGRTLTAEDDRLEAPPVIVISDTLSRRLFDDAAAALGQTITLSDRVHTVVGIMPPDFRFPDRDSDYWIPAQFDAGMRASRTEYFLLGVGRLRRDRTIGQAREDMAAISADLRRTFPQVADPDARVDPLKGFVTSSVESRLTILMGAVAFVLLIACANLANLLLARASGRQREIAVRQALGAGTRRVVRQLLTESVVLGVLGGLAGLAVGRWSLALLLAQLPPDLPRVEEIALDWTVTAVVGVVSLVAGALFGLFPAWQLSAGRPAVALREGERGSSGSAWIRSVLLVAEVALAVVLLVGAGLLIRSFLLLQRVDPGFNPERLLTFRVQLPDRYRPAERVAFFERAVAELGAIPGVRSSAAINMLPVAGRGIGAWLNVVGRPPADGSNPNAVPYRVVTPGYFATAGLRLIRGRLLTASDTREHTPAVVIDEALARRQWPGEDPLGREIILGALPDNPLIPKSPIVGIVSDVRQLGLDSDPPGMVYVPHRVMPFWPTFAFLLRTSVEPESVVATARTRVHALDPSLPVSAVRTADEVIAQSMVPARSSMVLLACFAGLALVMAAVGVYGVLSYTVSQRQREMGIRLALGAEPRRLRRLMLTEGLRQASIGIGIGLVGAFALTRLMQTLLFGVTPTDPLTFVGVVVLLGTVAALACYIPARRATQVDPVAIMRAE
jgi:putative ABC transport system permease protein